MAWMFLWTLLVGLPTSSAQLPTPADAFEKADKELQDELAGDDAEIEARLKRLEEKRGKRTSRVVVMKWPDSSVSHRNLVLQERVKIRIGRMNAKFYPAMDLYQVGRTEPGRLQPGEQLGRVPASNVAEVRSVVDRARQVPLDRLRGGPAQEVASRLRALESKIWYVEGPAERQTLFELYFQIGRAAIGMAEFVPPYYRIVGGRNANYYLYMAAAMEFEELRAGGEPLSRTLQGAEPKALDVLRGYVDGLKDGRYPLIPVSFRDQGRFDAERFAREYKVVVNGLERVLDDSGVVEVPRGRIDLHLERDDGFSMSETLRVQRLEDKIYFTLETARQRMGYQLLDQLMTWPDECNGLVDTDALTSLAIYARLHPNDELYLVIPKLGRTDDLYIWHYDPLTGDLNQLLDRSRGFPVRFAAMLGIGMSFNGGTAEFDPVSEFQSQANPGFDPRSLSIAPPNITPNPAGIPIDFQLRAHLGRLMVGGGVQFAGGILGPWQDKYQTQAWELNDPQREVTGVVDGESVLLLQERAWSRLTYGLLGVVLMKNAPYGLGPRGYLRVGGYNVPHALDMTGHVGFTGKPPGQKEPPEGRVRPIVDLDIYGGVMLPYGDTRFRTWTETDGGTPVLRAQVIPNLGFSAGAGLTF